MWSAGAGRGGALEWATTDDVAVCVRIVSGEDDAGPPPLATHKTRPGQVSRRVGRGGVEARAAAAGQQCNYGGQSSILHEAHRQDYGGDATLPPYSSILHLLPTSSWHQHSNHNNTSGSIWLCSPSDFDAWLENFSHYRPCSSNSSKLYRW